MRRLLDGVAMPVPHRSTEPVHPTHWLISTQVPTIVDVSMLLQPVNMVSEKVLPAADLALFAGGTAASSCRWAWRIILPLSPSRDSARG